MELRFEILTPVEKELKTTENALRIPDGFHLGCKPELKMLPDFQPDIAGFHRFPACVFLEAFLQQFVALLHHVAQPFRAYDVGSESFPKDDGSHPQKVYIEARGCDVVLFLPIIGQILPRVEFINVFQKLGPFKGDAKRSYFDTISFVENESISSVLQCVILFPCRRAGCAACLSMQHFLYFLPLPQGHGAFLPIFPMIQHLF